MITFAARQEEDGHAIAGLIQRFLTTHIF